MQARYLSGLPVWAGPVLAVIGAGFVGLAVAFAVVKTGGSTAPDSRADFPTPTTGTGTATATPEGSTRLLDGVPVLPLDVVDHALLKPGEVVYYTSDCSVCNGAELSRLVVDGGGVLHADDLLRANQAGLPAGYPLAPMVTDGAGMFAVAWCHSDVGPCGKRHDGSVDDVPRSLVVSEDGGVSWRLAADIPTGGQVVSVAGDDVLVAVGGSDGTTSGLLLPSGRSAAVPDSSNPAYVPHPDGLVLRTQSFEDDYGPETAIAIGTGQPAAWRVLQGADVSIVRVLDNHRLIATVSRPDKIGLPAVYGAVLVDLEAGTVGPFPGIEWTPERASVVTSLVEGPFLRVDAGGDCLNIRSTVGLGAPVLTCAADGVLLGDREDTWERDGVTWLAVRTPDGRSGWASSEYLR